MKNMKRILVTVVSALLLMAVTVAGTLAYLQDQTNIVTNTFEAGNVSFDEDMNGGLDEGKVWQPGDKYENGEAVSAADLGKHKDAGVTRVTENKYKMVPSKTYDKDPIVYIKAGSEPCYVFVEIENGMKDYLIVDDIETQLGNLGWSQIGDTNIWYYGEIVDALNITTDNIPVPVFQTITLRGDLSEDDLAAASSATITIKAYAVQAANLDDAPFAWSVTFGKTNE